ncbi:PIG-L deacetylase family protein [Actinoplanes sp. G11-F43]|uniref:PIG-L deacetylase family protein n=1 Tax=Actinoplanes sp. G11-F43 TaxID=3424130 RepID=UPI003D331482
MTVLVIAPHPDDETLGCGGTIAALAAASIEVYIIAVVCHGSNTGDLGEQRPANRSEEFHTACKALGATGSEVVFEPSMHHTLHDRQALLVALLESGCTYAIDKVRPDTVLIPAEGAYHQDHQVVHAAALAACRPRGIGSHTPPNVLGFYGPEDEWRAQPKVTPAFIEVTDVHERKIEALRKYSLQLRLPPHPRSIEFVQAADMVNGARFGVPAAEVFTPYRLDLAGALGVSAR